MSWPVKRLLPFAIIFSVLVGSLLVMGYLRRSALNAPHSTQTTATERGQPAVRPGAEPPHKLGSMDAPAMIEEFGDFECGACAATHSVLEAAKEEFGERLVIVFREFPLASHAHSLNAAHAAEASGLQGKFWEMHDLLYENQRSWHVAPDSQTIFEQYARRIGLDVERFHRDCLSELANRRVTLDRERGYSIGVNSTPTVFLNGREVPFESLTSDRLRELIRAELGAGSSGASANR